MFTTTIRERCYCGANDCVACRGKAAVAAYLAERDAPEPPASCDGCDLHPASETVDVAGESMALCADCAERHRAEQADDADEDAAEAMDGDHESALASVYGDAS